MKRRSPVRSFSQEYRLTDGSRVLGQIGQILEDFNVRMFVLPRRYLSVSSGAAVKAVQVLIEGDMKYLLINHANRIGFGTRLLRMAQVTHTVKWWQAVSSQDLVTGLQREDKFYDKGEFDVAMEFIETLHDNQNRKRDNFRVLTGIPVKVGDKLGDKMVKVSEPVHGVFYAEVQ
jgi:hypothetical protein